MDTLDRRLSPFADEFIAADLAQMQHARNYHEWMLSLIRPRLGKRILEIGSGIGLLTKELLAAGDFVCAIEPNPHCIRALREKFAEEKRLAIIPRRLEACDPLALKAQRFDTVVCCNVLEHIEDDRRALLAFKRILEETGGGMIIWLPAMPSAFGSIDRALGHFRRYSRKGIRRLLNDLGVQPRECRYVNALGFFGWFFNARFLKKTKQSDLQITLFDRLVPFLAKIEKRIRPSFGMSLFVAATIPAEGIGS